MSTLKEQLQRFIEQNDIEIIVLDKQIESLIAVQLNLNSQSWELLLDDELGCLNQSNQHLCLYMVLRELDIYKDEDDFLNWCNQNNTSPNSITLLDYYRNLNLVSKEVNVALGGFNIEISYLEYELRSGAFSEILNA